MPVYLFNSGWKISQNTDWEGMNNDIMSITYLLDRFLCFADSCLLNAGTNMTEVRSGQVATHVDR